MTEEDQDDIIDIMYNQSEKEVRELQLAKKHWLKENPQKSKNLAGEIRKTPIGNVYIPHSFAIQGLRVK